MTLKSGSKVTQGYQKLVSIL